ncbi:hypothetical protein AOLI_G00047610, partial [Acnodon oligacanthus]
MACPRLQTHHQSPRLWTCRLPPWTLLQARLPPWTLLQASLPPWTLLSLCSCPSCPCLCLLFPVGLLFLLCLFSIGLLFLLSAPRGPPVSGSVSPGFSFPSFLPSSVPGVVFCPSVVFVSVPVPGVVSGPLSPSVSVPVSVCVPVSVPVSILVPVPLSFAWSVLGSCFPHPVVPPVISRLALFCVVPHPPSRPLFHPRSA